MKTFIRTLFLILFVGSINAQNAFLEGYVFESGNRGFLNDMTVTVFDAENGIELSSCKSDQNGFFSCVIPINKRYNVIVKHQYFFDQEVVANSIGIKEGGKVFMKIEMNRAPGYMFEITMAEKRENEIYPC